MGRIVASGSPMAANNLFSAIRIVALNGIMNLVGGSSMVALFAITNNLNEFSICVTWLLFKSQHKKKSNDF